MMITTDATDKSDISDFKPLMISSHGGDSSSITSEDGEYRDFKFSTKPSTFDYVLFIPNAIIHSLDNIRRAFGWKFIAMIVIVYGIQQGLGSSYFSFARDYYFKDVEQLQPSVAQTFIAVSMTPWNIKPIYGMVSDSILIFGYHRIPYIVMAGVVGGIALSLLSLLPLSATLAVLLMFFVNLSVASPDVMIDGVVAERSKSHPKYATDLQSLCWGSQSLFSIIGYLTSGIVIREYGSRSVFGGLVVGSLLISVPALFNWLGEVRDTRSHSSGGCHCLKSIIGINLENFFDHQRIFYLALFLSALALSLSACALLIAHWLPRLCIVLSVAIIVITSILITFKKQLPNVANAALFIFLSNCLTPDIGTAMFYWLTDFEGGPQFSPPFIGFISAAGFAAMFVGVLLYNYYLASWNYRTIFTFSMVFLSCTSVVDVILVLRINLLFGIPDEVLVMGDSTLSPVIRRFYVLPLLILASKVCPQGAEATLFAMMMSLSNFGGAVSSYLGALLLLLFNINSTNYDNLVWVIIVKSLCGLLPLFLIPILVPLGSPADSIPLDSSSSSSDISSIMSSKHSNNSSSTSSSTHNIIRINNNKSSQVEEGNNNSKL